MSMPHLVIVGDSPMAQTLAEHGSQLDWSVDARDRARVQ